MKLLRNRMREPRRDRERVEIVRVACLAGIAGASTRRPQATA